MKSHLPNQGCQDNSPVRNFLTDLDLKVNSLEHTQTLCSCHYACHDGTLRPAVAEWTLPNLRLPRLWKEQLPRLWAAQAHISQRAGGEVPQSACMEHNQSCGGKGVHTLQVYEQSDCVGSWLICP